jgi:hypothetical protein
MARSGFIKGKSTKEYMKIYRENNKLKIAEQKRAWLDRPENQPTHNMKSKERYHRDIELSREEHRKWAAIRKLKKIHLTGIEDDEKYKDCLETYDFEIAIKPFSINSMYYATVKTKTKEYLQWQESFHRAIAEHKQCLMSLKREGRYEYFVTLVATYPKEIFTNSFGVVSAKTIDLSNWEKSFVDQLFLYTIDIDDRYITKLSSKKEDGDEYKIYCRVSVSKLYTNADTERVTTVRTKRNKRGA